jgi:hypothetical protein
MISLHSKGLEGSTKYANATNRTLLDVFNKTLTFQMKNYHFWKCLGILDAFLVYIST